MERCALVTGASRGIGAEISRRLAGEGYGLTLAARRDPGLRALADELRAETGSTIHTVMADMAVEEDLRRLAAEHDRRFSRLDVLVLNAGVGTSGPVSALPLKTYDLTLSVNLRAAFILLQATLPALRSTAALTPDRGAKVIAMASIAGVSAEAHLGAYAASKAGLISLCETVTLEEADNGITATAISPGLVATDMAAWADVPVAEMISTSDVAELVMALCRLTANAAVPNVVITRRGLKL